MQFDLDFFFRKNKYAPIVIAPIIYYVHERPEGIPPPNKIGKFFKGSIICRLNPLEIVSIIDFFNSCGYIIIY